MSLARISGAAGLEVRPARETLLQLPPRAHPCVRRGRVGFVALLDPGDK